MPFGDFRNLSEINSEADDLHPRLSSNGLSLYFASERNDSLQLFRSIRSSTDEFWESAEQLSFFDAFFDSPDARLAYPAISGDGQSLYFTYSMSGPYGHDIYVSHVVPLPGTALLGVLGLSVAGWRLRRRTSPGRPISFSSSMVTSSPSEDAVIVLRQSHRRQRAQST